MKLQGSEDLETRIKKNFLDILVLKYLKSHPSSSGYEILKYLHNEFETSFSPGTVYHAIYLLERENQIGGESGDNVRFYSLTDNGEETLNASAKSINQIQELIANILSDG